MKKFNVFHVWRDAHCIGFPAITLWWGYLHENAQPHGGVIGGGAGLYHKNDFFWEEDEWLTYRGALPNNGLQLRTEEKFVSLS